MFSFTFYRLILVAVLIWAKFYNDVYYGNHFIAYIGGVSLPELNEMEIEALSLLNWKLIIEPEEYALYSSNLRLHFA